MLPIRVSNDSDLLLRLALMNISHYLRARLGVALATELLGRDRQVSMAVGTEGLVARVSATSRSDMERERRIIDADELRD